MPDALTEYQQKADRLREIMPWATDDLIGVVIATCGETTVATEARGNADDLANATNAA